MEVAYENIAGLTAAALIGMTRGDVVPSVSAADALWALAGAAAAKLATSAAVAKLRPFTRRRGAANAPAPRRSRNLTP
jgi:hypothetical protein